MWASHGWHDTAWFFIPGIFWCWKARQRNELPVIVYKKLRTEVLLNNGKYSETRLIRTLKGNEKIYVLTNVRSIQNAISSPAGPVPRVHANDLPRKILLRPECRSILAFRAVKSSFMVLWIWKRAGKLKSKLKGSMTGLWSEKKEHKKGQKSAPGGKIGT